MAQDFEVEFIERGDRKARFLVRGLTPAFANGIRRAMIADVPTMSIDQVRVVENSSVMFDEMIALRLGLVPLTTPKDEFFEDDVVTLSLEADGPEPGATGSRTVYSGDLVSSDPMVEPADKNVPIIRLKAGQHIELEADAKLGRGQDHAKHQGGVAVGYRHLQRVEVGDDLGEFEEQPRNIIRGVVDIDGELVATEEFDNDLAQHFPGKEVSVTDVPNAFVFHVETDGSFTVEDLFVRAVDSIESRATNLADAIQL